MHFKNVIFLLLKKNVFVNWNSFASKWFCKIEYRKKRRATKNNWLTVKLSMYTNHNNVNNHGTLFVVFFCCSKLWKNNKNDNLAKTLKTKRQIHLSIYEERTRQSIFSSLLCAICFRPSQTKRRKVHPISSHGNIFKKKWIVSISMCVFKMPSPVASKQQIFDLPNILLISA